MTDAMGELKKRLLELHQETCEDGMDVVEGVADEDKGFIGRQVKEAIKDCKEVGLKIGFFKAFKVKRLFAKLFKASWWDGFLKEKLGEPPKVLEDYESLFVSRVEIALKGLDVSDKS